MYLKATNSYSNAISITSGVPQGSVLGPTLFLIYIHDTEDILLGSNVRMKLFADDAKLYSSFVYLSGDLQIVCDRLSPWAKE